MQLKVLSWNIWWDGNAEEIFRFLHAFDADIIALQEVVHNDPTRDVLGYLKKLGYDSFFAPALTLEDGRIVGNAVFSKQKIFRTETHILSKEEKRVAAEADIRLGDTPFRIFSVHLFHTHQQPSVIQDAQGDHLLRVVSNTQTIVMGDFNATPESSVIQKMQAAMVDTDPASTPTLSVDLFDCQVCDPKMIPKTRLDYIFTSKDIKTSAFHVEHSNGSDHFPISAVVDVEKK